MPTILLNGKPPADHERRCQGKSNVRKARCEKWALTGSKYCQFHGGRQRVVKVGRMKRVYSQHLGPTLKKRLEEMLDASHDDQVQLYEELALSRIMAQEAVALADIALSSADDRRSRTTFLPAVRRLSGSIRKNQRVALGWSGLDRVSEPCQQLAGLDPSAGGRASLLRQ